MLPEETYLERSPDALHRTIDGEAVILHAETGVYFTLNRVGSRIWTLLERGRTPVSLRDELLAEFEVPPEVLTKDIHSFLDELEEAGLVRRAV